MNTNIYTFEYNKKIILNRVKAYLEKYSSYLSFAEILSEAYLIFEKSKVKFDADKKTSFKTFLWKSLSLYLRDFCKSEVKKIKHPGTISLSSLNENYYTQNNDCSDTLFFDLADENFLTPEQFVLQIDEIEIVRKYVGSLSRPAHRLLKALMSEMFSVLNPLRQTGLNLSKVKKVLLKNWGWKSRTVERYWNELKYFYNQIK